MVPFLLPYPVIIDGKNKALFSIGQGRTTGGFSLHFRVATGNKSSLIGKGSFGICIDCII